MTLEKAFGDSDKSWGEIAANAVVDGAISFAVGNLIKAPGITTGQGNASAVYRAGLTKIRKGIAKNMSSKVVAKGLISSFTSGLAMDIYYGLKQTVYDPLRNCINSFLE